MTESFRLDNKRVFGRETRKIVVLFGTRPEVIKLSPVINLLKTKPARFQTVLISSGQHRELLLPFIKMFNLKNDYELDIMTENQAPSDVLARVVTSLPPIFQKEKPDFVVVQGDTTTALAGALAASHQKIAVAHVEAGLRSHDINSPFPEELNRRLIAPLAEINFAATPLNKRNLLAEGICEDKIFVTGNTIIEAFESISQKLCPSLPTAQLLEKSAHRRLILLTTHRRENFGEKMCGNLKVLRDFVGANEDFALVFPMHPNPNVRRAAQKIFRDSVRTYLIEPLSYTDFAAIMKAADFIVSDSGGVQEETPTLKKRLIVLRENTERPEAATAGFAKLAPTPNDLRRILTEILDANDWQENINHTPNPFGDGTAAQKIVETLENYPLREK